MTDVVPVLVDEVRAFRQAHPEIRYVDLICLDLPGHFYGKRYPIDALEKVAAGALLKLPQNCVLLGTQGGLYKIGDYCFNDGDPDAPRRLIPGTLKPVRWERQPLAQMLISSDGTDAPIEFEPREVLARVLRRFTARGIRPVVAFELEFYLFAAQLADGMPQYPRDRLSDDRDDQPNMHIERLSRFSDVLHEMVEAACEQGVDATVITAELGPGQFEINFGHTDDALRAADWSALFCRQHARRRIAARLSRELHGKPYLHAPGSGMHVHVSLYDDAGRNLLAADGQRPLLHAVAGCLALLPHCMPVFAPNHNAFRRYGSMVNAASRASWASRIATRASGFRNRMRAICASSIGSRARTRIRTSCSRRSWPGWSTGSTHGSSRSRRSTTIAAAGSIFRRRCCRPSRRCRITRRCATGSAASS